MHLEGSIAQKNECANDRQKRIEQLLRGLSEFSQKLDGYKEKWINSHDSSLERKHTLSNTNFRSFDTCYRMVRSPAKDRLSDLICENTDNLKSDDKTSIKNSENLCNSRSKLHNKSTHSINITTNQSCGHKLINESYKSSIVRSLRDSPKWSSIKDKFESNSCNSTINCSSPPLLRKSFATLPLSSSASLSNLSVFPKSTHKSNSSSILCTNRFKTNHLSNLSPINNRSQQNSNVLDLISKDSTTNRKEIKPFFISSNVNIPQKTKPKGSKVSQIASKFSGDLDGQKEKLCNNFSKENQTKFNSIQDLAKEPISVKNAIMKLECQNSLSSSVTKKHESNSCQFSKLDINSLTHKAHNLKKSFNKESNCALKRDKSNDSSNLESEKVVNNNNINNINNNIAWPNMSTQSSKVNSKEDSSLYESIYEPIMDHIDSVQINNSLIRSNLLNSDCDDVSTNSDGSSIYSESSSFSGHYELGPSRSYIKSSDPPPLPPPRNGTNKVKSAGMIKNIDKCKNIKGPEYEEIQQFLLNKMREDNNEYHIYNSIYNCISSEIPNSTEQITNLIRKLECLLKEQRQKELHPASSTLSCSSISRNDSSASSEKQESSFTSKSCKSSESNSPRSSSYESPIPPSRSQIEMKINEMNELNSDLNEKFSDKSLLSSIADSSPQLKEFLSFISNRSSAISSDYVEALNHERKITSDLSVDESRVHQFEMEGYLNLEETRSSLVHNQPLYQVYDMGVKLRRALWAQAPGLENDPMDDTIDDPIDSIYQELDECENTKCICTICEGSDVIHSHPHVSALDLVGKGTKKLWCEVPQVKDARILESLSSKERKHQEAMFEVITSEASYIKSLDILVNEFMNAGEFLNPQILDTRAKNDLFSSILSVRDVAKELMKDLDRRWQENVIISEVCDILYDYARNKFGVYSSYIMYQLKQEKTLKQLQKSPRFCEALQKLELNPRCQNLSLISFLLLPMQRITRYPLLVEAILNHRSNENNESYKLCEKTLSALSKVVCDCNLAAKKSEQWHELNEISQKLKFDKVKNFPLASSSRYLLKKCEATRLTRQESKKLESKRQESPALLYPTARKHLLWKRLPNLYLFLFNDLLVIAKKRSDDNYSVYDYCGRGSLEVYDLANEKEDVANGKSNVSQVRTREIQKNLIQLIFLENHAGKIVDYYFSFPSEAEKLRFLEAVKPPESENQNEKIYDWGDCPQVICEKAYIAQQPDELTLEESDVINVFRKQNEWYEGERIRDGARGWFPASNTSQIVNKHVRSRNLRLRRRLMEVTESEYDDISSK